MFDDFIAYYHENVVESYLAYRSTSTDGTSGRSRDLRTALTAASALFHLREHLPTDCSLSRAEAERLCADYAVLGDIANSSKHKSITNPTPHGPPLVQHANDLREQITIVQYEDADGSYNYRYKNVVATLTDGSEKTLIELLTSVLNFWEQHLHAHGHLPEARTFTCETAIGYKSRQDCEGNELNFEIVRGQRFNQSLQFLKFNSSTGQAEPVDLTGCDARMRIYKPAYAVDIVLTNDKTGQSFTRTVELTEEESAILLEQDNDEARQACLGSFNSIRAALTEIGSEHSGASGATSGGA